MTVHADDGTRILIGASSFADASAALRLIERVMLDLRPKLGGILVEETASLSLCDLPSQRVISASGQVVLAPTRGQVRTLIDADARAFRDALSHLADLSGASWSFRRDIGDLIETGLKTGTAMDVVVFAHRNIHPVAGKVVVLTSTQRAESRAAEMSRQLAQHVAADHVVMMIDDHGPGDSGPSDQGATLDTAMARLARLNAQAVFVDLAQGLVHSPDQLRHLLDMARCPVFVFGAASGASMLEYSTLIPPRRTQT